MCKDPKRRSLQHARQIFIFFTFVMWKLVDRDCPGLVVWCKKIHGGGKGGLTSFPLFLTLEKLKYFTDFEMSGRI